MLIRMGHFVSGWTQFPSQSDKDNWAAPANAQKGRDAKVGSADASRQFAAVVDAKPFRSIVGHSTGGSRVPSGAHAVSVDDLLDSVQPSTAAPSGALDRSRQHAHFLRLRIEQRMASSAREVFQ